jgi:hypothetical protein
MGFLTLFPSTPPTAEIPQPTPTVDVSTVSTKKCNVEIKNKFKVNQLLAKCYTPSGGLLLVKAKSTEHKKWMEEVNPC